MIQPSQPVHRWLIMTLTVLLPMAGLFAIVPQPARSSPTANYGVDVVPSAASQNADAGAAITQAIHVTNTGTTTDSYLLTPTSTGQWPTTVLAAGSATSVLADLGADQGVDVQLVVTIPVTATGGMTDVADLRVVSQSDSSISATAKLTTTVNVSRGVEIGPRIDYASGNSGDMISYSLWVTNTGNVSDVFTVISSSLFSWPLYIQPLQFDLAHGMSQTVNVSTSIPSAAMGGDQNVTSIQVNGTDISDTANLTTTVIVAHGVEVAPDAILGVGNSDEIVSYTLWVTNTGNVADTFVVVSSAKQGWVTNIEPADFSLGRGVNRTINISVEIPIDAFGGDQDVALVEVNGSGVIATATLTTTVNAAYGVSIDPPISIGVRAPGTFVTQTLHVTNTGNFTNQVNLAATSPSGWPPPMVSANQIQIPAHGERPFVVTFTVGTNVMSSTLYSVFITATSQSNPNSRAFTSISVVAGSHKVFLPIVMNDWPPRWTQGGMGGQTVYQVDACSANPARLYAGTGSAGVYRSDTAGASWTATTLGSGLVRGVAVNPQNCELAYAIVWGQGVLRTTNGGNNWTSATTSQPELYGYALAIDSRSPYTMYVGLHTNGIYRSINGGATWTKVSGLANVPVTGLAMSADGSVYAATYGNGVYHVQGTVASPVGSLPSLARNTSAVAVDPDTPSVLYVATESGLYRYSGSSWESALSGVGRVFSALVDVDPHGVKSVYAGAENNGVWRSVNDQMFQLYSNGISGLTVRSIEIGSQTASYVQIGTTNGAWRFPYP